MQHIWKPPSPMIAQVEAVSAKRAPIAAGIAWPS
jgi:hypothetical protein